MKSVQEILDRIDPYDQEQRAHFDEALAQARRECPVLHSEAYGGIHYVTRYDDVRSVCERPQVFSSRDPSTMGPMPIRMIPLDSDLPDQQVYRKILNPYFSRTFLLRYSDQLRRIANDLVDGFVSRGRFDVVEDYATPFSAQALATVVLVTADESLMKRAIPAVEKVGAPDQTEQDMLELAAVAMEAMNEAENDTTDRDDVLAGLVAARPDGRSLSVEERLGIITTLFAGGLDTTKGALTDIVHHLATRPGLEQAMREPDWTRTLLDEFLRLSSTVGFMARTALEPAKIGDVEVPAGSRVVVGFASANRDESRFEEPNEFTPGRSGNAHAAFGLGIHRCLGSNFARIQLEIAASVLVERLTNFRVAPDSDVVRAMGQSFRLTGLHVEFDERSSAPR